MREVCGLRNLMHTSKFAISLPFKFFVPSLSFIVTRRPVILAPRLRLPVSPLTRTGHERKPRRKWPGGPM